jgi:hypothetical protein
MEFGKFDLLPHENILAISKEAMQQSPSLSKMSILPRY